MWYAIGREGEPVRQFVTAPATEAASEEAREGEIAVAAGASPRTGGVIVDGALTFPTPSLDMLKTARWADALAYRNAQQEGGCGTPLGRVDTDANSQRKINGAATAAMIARVVGQPFTPIGWTMADNSVVEHDAAAVIAMGMAVIAYLNACQQAGTVIRAQIDGAADVTALVAVDITAGYPS